MYLLLAVLIACVTIYLIAWRVTDGVLYLRGYSTQHYTLPSGVPSVGPVDQSWGATPDAVAPRFVDVDYPEPVTPGEPSDEFDMTVQMSLNELEAQQFDAGLQHVAHLAARSR